MTAIRQSADRRRTFLMIAPVLAVTGGLLATGLAAAAAQSLGLVGPGATGTFTLDHYRRVLADREFHAALGLTLWVASASTALSTGLGVALALLLRRVTTGRRVSYALLQVPLGVPHLAVAAAFLTLLSPSGWLARFAHAAGLVAAPADMPPLVYDAWGLGIILAYTAREVPFLAVVATALLVRLDEGYDAVARTLGASRWQRLRHVTWPLIAPGVSSAALMVFAFVFAAFETPFLLGRPYPAMLAVVAQHRYLSVELADRPAAVALALVMTALAGLLAWASLRLQAARSGETRPMMF